MAKNNTATVSELTPAPVALPANDVDTIISALTNPDARKAAEQRLDSEIAQLEMKLENLKGTRALLSPQAPTVRKVTPRKPKTDGQPSTDGHRPVGRPKGSGGTNHATAIKSALGRNKMNLEEVFEALGKAGHDIQRKTLSTYLSNMANAGELGKEGSRRNFSYWVAK